MKQEVEDQIVKSVLAKYVERSNTGLKKYGTPLTRNDLTLEQWINHLQEELMDATLVPRAHQKRHSVTRSRSV
jgi:hypothetical protein